MSKRLDRTDLQNLNESMVVLRLVILVGSCVWNFCQLTGLLIAKMMFDTSAHITGCETVYVQNQECAGQPRGWAKFHVTLQI